LLYILLKIPAKFALWIYCRLLLVNKKEMLQSNGPLLIAANHPNSFLDAVILATVFKKPIYSLARGDAFANSFYSRLLGSMNMLPVYRISEGVENLEHNYKTFDACKAIFKKNGIVLIFSEGRCINEWRLRSLKKGTARLALSAWEDGTALKVLPCGINYSSFVSFGKNVRLNFGEMITARDFDLANSFGNNVNEFNNILQKQLQQLVVEIDKKDITTIKEKFEVERPLLKRIILFMPAVLGFLLNAPLYYPIKKFTEKRAAYNDHYDSVMVGLLFIFYPFYLLLVGLLLYLFIGSWHGLLIFILLPFCAWSYVQLKHQL